jgi:hypothetical protein
MTVAEGWLLMALGHESAVSRMLRRRGVTVAGRA